MPLAQSLHHRIKIDETPDIIIQQRMNAINPKYVPLNYLAQLAIDKAEQGDFRWLMNYWNYCAIPTTNNPTKKNLPNSALIGRGNGQVVQCYHAALKRRSTRENQEIIMDLGTVFTYWPYCYGHLFFCFYIFCFIEKNLTNGWKSSRKTVLNNVILFQ